MNSTDDTTITLDLSIETIGKLALQAHERDMKLNDFIIDVMTEYAKEVKNEKGPEFLTEDQT
jgi:uncharacterized protein (DUF1778 family)